jgi:hypothetical protein
MPPQAVAFKATAAGLVGDRASSRRSVLISRLDPGAPTRAIGGPSGGECVADSDLRNEILRLEERIDDLAEAIARSRRISQISKIAIVGGLIWTLATILGAVAFVPAAVIIAMAATIGGVVLFGSTATTAKETLAEMQATEAHRAELIGRMQLRVVGEDPEEQRGRSRGE